jgi:hypothetical protein
MTSVKFGTPERFEITLGWLKDREPRELGPAHSGWSSGELKISVGGHVLTLHKRNGKDRESVQWYLLPVFEWLADQWMSLFHEERFAWHENSSASAAISAFMATRRLIAADDELGREQYRAVQSWWFRHALRAADSSALYPDLYFRRLGNDIELSWTARQPVHAPDGFRYCLTPGTATVAVGEVVGPLWQALNWFVDSASVVEAADRHALAQLRLKLDHLNSASAPEIERYYLPQRLFARISRAKEKIGLSTESTRHPTAPAIAFMDNAVLMFGGASPDICEDDVESLLSFLLSRSGMQESPALAQLVDTTIGAPIAAPFEEGYELANALIEQLDLLDGRSFVDIAGILSDLEIEQIEQALVTDSIRGVAVAGMQFAPAILVNTTSQFNQTEAGRRFTLAHELFHILYDRARARCVTHTSGPWASPGVEKRANAFADMLLMPHELVSKYLTAFDMDGITSAAKRMRVGRSALIEHLYNLNEIDEMQREILRNG